MINIVNNIVVRHTFSSQLRAGPGERYTRVVRREASHGVPHSSGQARRRLGGDAYADALSYLSVGGDEAASW